VTGLLMLMLLLQLPSAWTVSARLHKVNSILTIIATAAAAAAG
jgi:hypothetical protein